MHRVLQFTEHRPFPVPDLPWVMRQRWDDVLFLHWPVPPDVLRPHIPDEVELDLYDGAAWIGIVLFEVKGLRGRFLPPLPFTSTFPEVNVRTYVRKNGKPGVYFFSLDTTNKLAIKAARTGYSLPYFFADVSMDRSSTEVNCRSIRKERGLPRETLQVTYRPTGKEIPNEEGSFEHWMAERYCLCSLFGDELFRTDIHHRKWALESVDIELTSNTMAQYVPREYFSSAPKAHYSISKNTLFWLPVKEHT
jgi:uncharacterized protein